MKKIDFVITWVDASDQKWCAKKNKYLPAGAQSVNSSNERYRDYGTLKFLLRSIDIYAKWVNKVYLVTDEQIPEWISLDSNKLVLVDHKEIISPKYLPTFNSNAIEFNIDHIQGLSEQFVVFNDDFLINDVVQPVDFFKNNLPRDFRLYIPLEPFSEFDKILFNNNLQINQWLQGEWYSKRGVVNTSYGKNNLKNILSLIKKRHLVSNYAMSHNALSFSKSSYKEAKSIWQNNIEKTMSNKFRTSDDLNTWLIRYYQLELGHFYPRSPKFSQFYALNEYEKIEQDLEQRQHKLICINDTSATDFSTITKKLNVVLENKFPKKSMFEK